MPLQTGGASGKSIISERDIAEIRQHLAAYRKYIEEYSNCITNLLRNYANEEIVQSFFASGKFGEDKRTNIINLTNRIIAFQNSMINDPDGAIKKSEDFLNNQERLLRTGVM